METNINPSAISAVLILMAAASLFTMLSLNQINYIVHGDLYNYGLQFSYKWAVSYWVFSGIVFGLSWINISLSIIIALYIFKKGRKQKLESEDISQDGKMEEAAQLEEKKQRELSEYVERPKEITEEKLVEEITQREGTVETIEMVKAQEAQTDAQEEGKIEQNEENKVPIS